MTAYSRTFIETKLGRFVLELQTINRKFLDVNSSLPKELLFLEGEIRKWIGETLTRGQVNLKLAVSFTESAPVKVAPNLPLVRQLKAAFDEIIKDLGLGSDAPFDLNLLLSQKDVVSFVEDIELEGVYREVVQDLVTKTLVKLIEMKDREGEVLQLDITKRLATLQHCVEQIAAKGANATSKYRQKLVERLEEVLPGCVENEERIMREVCLYAERLDVSEEITRFTSHLQQFNELLSDKKVTSGKTLEFILQEMGREVNTIGSKSSDIEITRLVIEIKSELEKIREQIQNVE